MSTVRQRCTRRGSNSQSHSFAPSASSSAGDGAGASGAGGAAKPLHQDNYFFQIDPPGAMLTAWIALDDALEARDGGDDVGQPRESIV